MDDAFNWTIECLEELIKYAEEYGIILALENHWGLTRDSMGILRILKSVNSKWLRALMDTGNFIEKPINS